MSSPHLGRPRLPLRPLTVLVSLLCASAATAQERVLHAGTHHLRMGSGPEWTESASHPHARVLSVSFAAAPNAGEQTLSLRQGGVRQRWRVLLNGRELGFLLQDENAMVTYTPVPAGVLVAGENTLRIEPVDSLADDIEIGRIVLGDRPLRETLAQASLELEVLDEGGERIPARVTITDELGALQQVDARSGDRLAVRTGFVYTGSGRASITLPAGAYRIYAGRGFEYGVDSARVVLHAGDAVRRTLRIGREVPTRGWVAADTHVHTLTHSGHGDATVEERVLTLAGEGIELPVLTEHNLHADLEPVARALGMREHFTPVMGNEVTTPVGHFNIFPVSEHASAPPSDVRDWDSAGSAVRATPGVHGIVLNHARDVHGGFRPFGVERHVAVAGMNLDGWLLPANAMEVINSGAQQNDPLQLYGDWLSMLNRGHFLTPTGASDSHDVGRFLVGQARTYIRVADEDPGRIDVGRAMERFQAGAVMVSFGLLAELSVDSRYGPGDLVRPGDELEIAVRVLGPAWTRAERVSLYANGRRIRTAAIERGDVPGVKWSGSWTIPRPSHDVHLVAIAEGPGEHRPFWPIARPYQSTSPDVDPRVIGSSGAVWIDADGDGRATEAHAYASRLVAESDGDLPMLVRLLASFDEAVAVQAAAILTANGTEPGDPAVVAALADAAPGTRHGFEAFAAGWEESRAARRSAAR